MLAVSVFAQDAGKEIKSGKKALSKYNADPTNTAALDEARAAAESATTLDASLSGGWMLLGDVYAAQIGQVSNELSAKNAEYEFAKITDPEAAQPDFSTTVVPGEAADKALEAYQKAYATATKSSYKKAAKDAMQTVSSQMGMVGNAMLGAGRYVDAYKPLVTMNTVDNFLRENNEDPIFADDAALNQQKYITAVVAEQAGDTENAKKLYKELYEAGYEEAAVYAGYSGMLMSEGDREGGLEVLNAGRERFPDNSEILFAEINYYIQAQDFATLETKLQKAIAAEPNNAGLYTALGNVYMNLGQGEEDVATQDGYYEKSMEYFTKASELDPQNVDAIYSMGSMKFNKAVALNSEMSELGNSKAEQAKYDEMNAQVTKLFDEALPYFERAEKIDPDDQNTLIALKEIYARRGDYDTSNKYKARLSGGN